MAYNAPAVLAHIKGMAMNRKWNTWIAAAFVGSVMSLGSVTAAHADDAGSLGGCEGIKLKVLLRSTRPTTLNDVMASWIGSNLREVVGKWGPPQGTFDNRDGSRILSWKEQGPNWGVCTKTFQADANDALQLWSLSGDCGCTALARGTEPRDTPVPRMTL
jgi:hypothetical protein